MRHAYTLVGAAALLVGAGCADLDVSNPNNPDIDRALATPEDVKNLAISSVRSWYLSSTTEEPWLFTQVTADVLTANFGNFGMRFNNLEPRIAYENNSAGGDRAVAEVPWDNSYSVLGAANDVLRALDGGLELPGGETEQYRHLAMFSQAAALTNLALLFDQAFVVDESYDPGAPDRVLPELQPYTEVAAAALAKWEALIAATADADYTYDATDLPLNLGPDSTFGPGADISTLTSEILHRISNTFAALLLAYTPRDAAEAEGVNWGQVAAFANNGIGEGAAGEPIDFAVVGDGGTNWWSYINLYGNLASWLRVDMRVINLLDPSQPATFTGTIPPPASSADARGDCGPVEDGTAECGDFRYEGGVIGDPGRGIYMQSPYSHKRYEYHNWDSPFGLASGPVPYILAAESDLVRAEGLIRSGGDLSVAADLINNTRVRRGGLTPATAADGVDALLDMIRYERDIELINTNGWDLFRRRIVPESEGGLRPGTVRQLPIPAKELETLGLPIYTFGGT